MRVFHLRIVTPDGLFFDGEVQRIILRTTEGDAGILAGHADYVAPLSTGVAKIVTENGEVRYAACNGGLLSVQDGEATVAATTFEWGTDIDISRAERAKAKAEEAIKDHTGFEEKAAEVKLKRAVTRIKAKNMGRGSK